MVEGATRPPAAPPRNSGPSPAPRAFEPTLARPAAKRHLPSVSTLAFAHHHMALPLGDHDVRPLERDQVADAQPGEGQQAHDVAQPDRPRRGAAPLARRSRSVLEPPVPAGALAAHPPGRALHAGGWPRRRIAAATERMGPSAYARVELVDDDQGRPQLLELELVEPSLFLDTAAGLTQRLAAALAQRIKRSSRACRD